MKRDIHVLGKLGYMNGELYIHGVTDKVYNKRSKILESGDNPGSVIITMNTGNTIYGCPIVFIMEEPLGNNSKED